MIKCWIIKGENAHGKFWNWKPCLMFFSRIQLQLSLLQKRMCFVIKWRVNPNPNPTSEHFQLFFTKINWLKQWPRNFKEETLHSFLGVWFWFWTRSEQLDTIDLVVKSVDLQKTVTCALCLPCIFCILSKQSVSVPPPPFSHVRLYILLYSQPL